MVTAGIAVGLATGGVPAAASRTVQQLALIVAMTFSLTEITFRGISLRTEARGIGLAFLATYGVMGGLVLAFAAVTTDADLRSGWVLMAAVPPAVAVVPITSFLRGNVRSALIADALLYLLGLIAIPVLTLALLGQGVPVSELVLQTVLLIGVPILLSRPLLRWRGVHEARPTAVCAAFFVLVLAIVGSAREVLFGRPDLVLGLAGLALARTFGLGVAVFAAGLALRLSRNTRVAASTFGGFKNLGLTVVLASTVFGAVASLPAVVCLIFETAWMSVLPLLFRTPSRGVTEIAE
jgi:BASS family bile acid:Na+ symporter